MLHGTQCVAIANFAVLMLIYSFLIIFGSLTMRRLRDFSMDLRLSTLGLY